MYFNAHFKPSNSLGRIVNSAAYEAHNQRINQVPITDGWPGAFRSEKFAHFVQSTQMNTGGIQQAIMWPRDRKTTALTIVLPRLLRHLMVTQDFP